MKHCVYLDHKLGVTHFLIADRPYGEMVPFQTRADRLKSRCDCPKGLGSGKSMIDKDQIKVDRETGHVSDKEVDGSPALECEDVPIEYIRSNPEQEPDGIDV